MSTHSCDVVKIKLEEHPNADSLSVVRVGGYQCVVKTEDWKDGDLGTYIPPDSLVPTSNPQFAFLQKKDRSQERVKAIKLRGVWSQGLLIHAPKGATEGQDLMKDLGIKHYEPPLSMSTGGDNEQAPPGHYPKYDVENFNRYNTVIQEGDEVVITEKIHGANARYKWYNGRIYCGSRTNWKKEYEKSIWWRALRQNPWIEEWCKTHPDFTLYGEVFGQVQNLKYGAGSNDIFFRVFDMWDGTKWLDYHEAMVYAKHKDYPGSHPRIKWVPVLYVGLFDENYARELAEDNSSFSDAQHHREGIVIKPIHEKWDQELGRVILKIVGNKYLAKS